MDLLLTMIIIIYESQIKGTYFDYIYAFSLLLFVALLGVTHRNP